MADRKIKCCEPVSGGSAAWSTRPQCHRNATVTRGGKPYCKQHDPENIEAKREARNKTYEERHAKERQAWARSDALREIAYAAIAWVQGGSEIAVTEAVKAWEKLP